MRCANSCAQKCCKYLPLKFKGMMLIKIGVIEEIRLLEVLIIEVPQTLLHYSPLPQI